MQKYPNFTSLKIDIKTDIILYNFLSFYTLNQRYTDLN